MQLKIKDLLASTNALSELSKEKLPAKTAYRVGKNLRLIQQELDHYETTRRGTIETFGEPVEGQPGSFQVKKENLKVFEDSMNALLDTEVDIMLMGITVEDLGDCNLAPSVFASLHWMINEAPQP